MPRAIPPVYARLAFALFFLAGCATGLTATPAESGDFNLTTEEFALRRNAACSQGSRRDCVNWEIHTQWSCGKRLARGQLPDEQVCPRIEPIAPSLIEQQVMQCIQAREPDELCRHMLRTAAYDCGIEDAENRPQLPAFCHPLHYYARRRFAARPAGHM